jgi:hypothetical protein
MGTAELATVSVVLPPHVDIAGRSAVPVEIRDERGARRARIPAEGGYHLVPGGIMSLSAVLPGGAEYRVSGDVPGGGSARMTLRGRPLPPNPHAATARELDHERSYARFLLQSSLDDYEAARRKSFASTVRAGMSDLALRYGASDHAVSFLQIVSGSALPTNVAYLGGAGVRLVPIDRRVAADVTLVDGRVELALRYLEESRLDEAAAVIATIGGTAAEERDPLAAVVRLHVDLATGRLEGIEAEADRLLERFPRISDFAVLRAELAALQGRDSMALSLLARLRSSGLPVLRRSYLIAAMRMAVLEADGFPGAPDQDKEDAHAVARRLAKMAGHTDPASPLLVMTGADPKRPSASLPWWRKAWLHVRQLSFPYRLESISNSASKQQKELVSVSSDQQSSSQGQVGLAGRLSPAVIALGVVIVALLATAVVLLISVDQDDVPWTRMAWVFASFQSIALVGIGMFLGAAPFRQRAERAEAEAAANRHDAANGRALAASILADDPAVVLEAGEKRRPTPADERVARHVRLARQLFG